MKIIINDLAASSSGAMSVLKSFYNYICKDDTINDYVFLLSDNYLEDADRIKTQVLPHVKKSGFHKLYFDLIYGKKFIAQLKPDRVISLQNIITFGYKGMQDVYIQQSIPFQNIKRFSFLKKNEREYAKYQYIIGFFIKQSAKKARRVYVQTEWMKRAVAQKARIPEEKIIVVPIDVDAPSVPAYVFIRNSFFYPASFENVYKNQECIYRAAELLRKDGLKDFQVSLTLDHNHIEKAGCCFVGHLDQEELYQMYSQSILIFASFIETVGLPLVEAKSCGAVIFAADCEYAHEVLNGYPNAYFFNPFKAEELANLMKKAINGEIIYVNSFAESKQKPVCLGWARMIEEKSFC